MNTQAVFHHNEFYHVYNRTNNQELLFRSEENYSFFLRRYKYYLSPFLFVHAYALLPNHFHLSVRIKSEEDIIQHLESVPADERTVAISQYTSANDKEEFIDNLIIHQHQRFFISYAQAFNKMYSRNGNLFARKFKRSQFEFEAKFKYLQYYIHHNARKHGIVKHFLDDEHHSYSKTISNDNSLIDTSFVLDTFGSLEKFVSFHDKVHAMKEFYGLEIEEDGF